MKLQDVQERLATIKRIAGDDEAAHSAEDGLWMDVLAHIAAGGRNGKAMAELALKTTEVDFQRWCA